MKNFPPAPEIPQFDMKTQSDLPTIPTSQSLRSIQSARSRSLVVTIPELDNCTMPPFNRLSWHKLLRNFALDCSCNVSWRCNSRFTTFTTTCQLCIDMQPSWSTSTMMLCTCVCVVAIMAILSSQLRFGWQKISVVLSMKAIMKSRVKGFIKKRRKKYLFPKLIETNLTYIYTLGT